MGMYILSSNLKEQLLFLLQNVYEVFLIEQQYHVVPVPIG